MPAAITVENLTLSVPIYLQRERKARNWGEMFLGAAFDPPRRKLTRLLHDISFEAKEGDRIAILGRNGAGKSTLLRVLNGVYSPTSGHVGIHGSCQALLNISLGFNVEATVRENIFLRGTAMGLKAAILRDHIEAILDFAGLQEKSSHRLRTLSSGQRMRLGFAITTSVQNDIILMDEWVGTGDSEFMAKATERMKSRVGGSKIVMLASHSVGLLRDICNRGIVLERGALVYAGGIVSALKAYHDLMATLETQTAHTSAATADVSAYGCVESFTVEPGVVYLKGWMVDNSGAVPEGLVMEIRGHRYPVAEIERHDRRDVMTHLGLSQANCGFRAKFLVPTVASLSDMGRDLMVLGGANIDLALAPLRIAPTVEAMLSE